jgi:hypothetical protein
MSYVGALLSPRGGDCEPSSSDLQLTPATSSAAIALHQMARRRKRPRPHPVRHNGPRAPSPPDEAIPSHLLPMMGGASMPTTTHLTSAGANDRDHRSNMSLPSLPPMTLPSPSHQPFTIEGGNSTYLGGEFIDSFRVIGVLLPPQKSSRQKHCPRRVCRHHGLRAPNLLESFCGCRHRPRAPNISPEAS